MDLHYNPHFVPTRTRKLVIKNYFEDKQDEETIAGRYSISVYSVKKYLRRWEKTGTILSEFELKKESGEPIRRKKIYDNMDIYDYTDEKCLESSKKSLMNYTEDIMGHFGIYVSESTVNRHFLGKGWKWKRISRVALEADIYEEKLFWDYLGEIVANKDQLLFIDESNRFDTTANPTHGRGPGYVCVLHILSHSNSILY